MSTTVLLPTADNDYGVASNNITFIPNFGRISPVLNHMKYTDMIRPTCISSTCCVKTYKMMMITVIIIQFFIIHGLPQQPQGQSQLQHRNIRTIKNTSNKQKHI